jgi:hypothetical protein
LTKVAAPSTFIHTAMLVSHLHHFVFLKTRKTAGTSLEIALSRFAGPKDVVTPDTPEDESLRLEWGGLTPQNRLVPRARWGGLEWARWVLQRPDRLFYNHMPAHDVRRFVGRSVWDSYFKFTIERNPWDLAVSAWFWYSTRAALPFDEFVRSDRLKAYSNWGIYTIRNRIAVDWVIRYELLPELLPEIATRVGLPETPILPRAKGNIRKDRRPYQEWYRDAEKERVARVFHQEIDAFGWTFD